MVLLSQGHSMTELCELAIKYKTDKVGKYMHHYTPVYYDLFKNRRNDVTKVLEIGIGYDNGNGMEHVPDYKGGASLRMWEEFFPNARIFGADIRTDNHINEGRIKCFQCDQSDRLSLDSLIDCIGNEFDLIIDDGSHKPEHQKLSARVLLPLLKKTGVYVIEDVNNAFLNDIVDQFDKDYDCKVITLKDNPTLVDDNLILICKSEYKQGGWGQQDV